MWCGDQYGPAEEECGVVWRGDELSFTTRTALCAINMLRALLNNNVRAYLHVQSPVIISRIIEAY